jgi:hypothetical protein
MIGQGPNTREVEETPPPGTDGTITTGTPKTVDWRRRVRGERRMTRADLTGTLPRGSAGTRAGTIPLPGQSLKEGQTG